jgi:hypothetical protein
VKTLSFVLVDESTLTDDAHGGALTEEILQSIADACEEQANNDIGPEWGVSATVRVGKPDGSDVGALEVACWIKDSLPDVPGAVGYHATLANGAPVAFFAREDCSSLTAGAESLSVCLSHEIGETLGDMAANLWADMATQQAEKARELCDQCQNTCYAGKGGVDVSNFLLPSAFDPGASGPFDKMGVLQSQDDFSNGYMITRVVDQSATDQTPSQKVVVHGAIKPTQKKRHPSSRTRRRGACVDVTPAAVEPVAEAPVG